MKMSRAELLRALPVVAFVLAMLGMQISRGFAIAAEPRGEVLLHGPSWHFDESANYNNANYGVGYVFPGRIAVGVYRNSEYHTSAYAAYGYQLSDHVAVQFGAATGYETSSVVPLVLLNFTVPVADRLRLHLNVMPFYTGFINLTLGYRL